MGPTHRGAPQDQNPAGAPVSRGPFWYLFPSRRPHTSVRRSERSLIKGLFVKTRARVSLTMVTEDETHLRTGGCAGSQLCDHS